MLTSSDYGSENGNNLINMKKKRYVEEEYKDCVLIVLVMPDISFPAS